MRVVPDRISAIPSVAFMLVAAVSLVSSSVAASDLAWERSGPEGGEVSSLAIHPDDASIVFAGTNDGVYRSDDGGLTWTRSSTGLGSQTVPTIIINPDRPDEMVVLGWYRSELYKSEDGGATWRALEVGDGDSIEVLRSSPAPFTLYATTRRDIFVSTDSGETWSKKTDSLGEVRDLEVHPSRPELIIAAVAGDGVVVSEDGGASWSECGPIAGGAYHVAFGPFNPNVVYARDWEKLYRSVSGCHGWGVIDQPDLNRYGFLVADPSRPRTVYADTLNGPIVSSDRGKSWREFGPDLNPLSSYDMAISPLDPNRIYLAAETLDERRGVFRSDDGGLSWEIGTHGFYVNSISTVVFDPSDSTIGYAGASKGGRGNGVFKTSDSGWSWTFLDGTEGAGPCVAIDPLAPGTVYTASANGGVLKSIDAGETWTEVWGGLSGRRIGGIEVDPHRSGTLFILIAGQSYEYEAYRSDDGGETWVQLTRPGGVTVVGIYLDPHSVGVVYAATYYRLFRSSDFGESWVSISEGLDTPPNCWEWGCADYHVVTDLNFDLTDSQTMYASTRVGPFRTTNGGLTWEAVRNGVTICCFPVWSDECDELTEPAPFTCEGWPEGLAVDPNRPSTVYTATSLGTYRSYNQGDNWELIIGPDQINPEAIIAVGDGLVLGASDRAGVLRLTTSPVPPPRRPGRRALPQGSSTLTVGPDGEFTSIRNAVERAIVAGGNNEIRMQAGLYTESVFVKSAKGVGSLTISGGWDSTFNTRVPQAEITTIDAAQNGRPLTIEISGGEIFVDSLTFTGGLVGSTLPFGGGIHAWLTGDSKIRLDNCRIVGNTVDSPDQVWGGGLSAWLERNSELHLSGVEVLDNTAHSASSGGGSGGLYIVASDSSIVEISSSVIERNRVTSSNLGALIQYGGIAVFGDDASIVTLEDVQVKGNLLEGSANVWVSGAQLGGGQSLVVRRCRFVDNQAPLSNSVFHIFLADGKITDSLVAGGNSNGALLGTTGTSVTATNLTVADAPGTGVTLNLGFESGITVYNSIFFGNGNDLEILSPGEGTVDMGFNLIGINPGFVDSTGRDYRLRIGSVAENSGTNSPPGGLGALDCNGGPRIIDDVVDAGAFEGVSDIFIDGFKSSLPY